MRTCLGRNLLVLIAAVATGCAHRQPRPITFATNAQPLEALLPATLVHPLPLSGYYDRQVGPRAEVEQQLESSSPPPATYRALAPEQCQCLAVKASSEGNRMATERRVLIARASPHGLTENEQLKLQVLWASEQEARNRSASAALTSYYRIAQAEANRPILQKSLAEVDDALAKVDRLRANGLSVPFDDGELRRQRLDLVDRQLKLTNQLDQLNAELVQLIGASTTDARPRIWPATDFTVNVTPIDLEQAVAVGLTTRPELRLLTSLQSSLSAKNVSVTRGVVGGPTAVAMLSIAHFCKLIKQCRSNRRELPTRDRQLAERYDQRRREVTAEIQQAVFDVVSKLQRIAVEKELVSAWQFERDKLSRKKQIDEATFVDVTRARLKLFEAESAEVEQIIDWKIALVELKETQGLLVAECLGTGCRFLDSAAAVPPAVNPPAEFIMPEENLLDGDELQPSDDDAPLPPQLVPYAARSETFATEVGQAFQPDAHQAGKPDLRFGSSRATLPPVLPLPGDEKSVVTRVPSSPAETPPSPPDMAVEPLSGDRPEPAGPALP